MRWDHFILFFLDLSGIAACLALGETEYSRQDNYRNAEWTQEAGSPMEEEKKVSYSLGQNNYKHFFKKNVRSHGCEHAYIQTRDIKIYRSEDVGMILGDSQVTALWWAQAFCGFYVCRKSPVINDWNRMKEDKGNWQCLRQTQADEVRERESQWGSPKVGETSRPGGSWVQDRRLRTSKHAESVQRPQWCPYK